jgi:hypothetical protein
MRQAYCHAHYKRARGDSAMSEQSRARDLIQKARQTNRERDEIDRRSGFSPSGEAGQILLLRAAMTAIWWGLETDDMDAVGEGYDMLACLHLHMAGATYDPESSIQDEVSP